MKTTRMKKLLIATTATLVLGGTVAVAGHGDRDCDGSQRGHMMKHHSDFKGGFGGGKFDRKEMFERSYDKEQIRTLTEARLIMQGNDNLKVGKISATGNGYNVRIVTKDNSLVEELELAPNGMPLDRYQRIQEHMEERSKR